MRKGKGDWRKQIEREMERDANEEIKIQGRKTVFRRREERQKSG